MADMKLALVLVLASVVIINIALMFGGYALKQEAVSSNLTSDNQTAFIFDRSILEEDGAVYVTLNKENGYKDNLESGYFTREFTSGPGTGVFIGKGYEFSKGPCNSTSFRGFWTYEFLGCGEEIFKTDWCACLRDEPSLNYTLRFFSWTTTPDQNCTGDCNQSLNLTSYARVKGK